MAFAKAAKHWPVIVGDWNFEPAELRRFMDIEDVQLAIVAPDNSDFTCLAGRGAPTTYMLVSAEVASLVDVCATVSVPWGTHLGLRFHMAGPRSSPW